MDDKNGFEEFAVATMPMLHRTAWLLAGQREAAEDLVQDTLVKLHPRWRNLAAMQNPQGYARTVLVRIFLKGRRLKRSSELPVAEMPEVGRVRDPALRLIVHEALLGLTPTDRAVVVLRYFADRTVRDVSTDLGISESGIRSRSSRALAQLRSELGDEVVGVTSSEG